MFNKESIIDNIKTLFYALIIAIIIRSLIIQPFYIPSSSMEPTLLVGDRLFVTKYSYGYSKHSFPFRPPIFKDRIIYCGNKKIDVFTFEEKLPNNKVHKTVYLKNFGYQNSDVFEVPEDFYFFLGDNRDCSKDSRFLSSVGYVHKDNLVGKARFIFFSSDKSKGNLLFFWKWKDSIRFDRFFKKIN